MARSQTNLFLVFGISSLLLSDFCREALAHPYYAVDCSGCHGNISAMSTTPNSGSTLAFGKTLVGQSKSAALTISNTSTVYQGGGFSGSFPAASGPFSLSGSGALSTQYGGFLVPPAVQASDGGDSSATGTYIYAPTVRGVNSQAVSFTPSAGFYPGTAPTANFTFSGQGVAPVISLDTSTVAAGSVRIGTTATESFTVKDIGDGNQAGAGLGNLTGTVAGGSNGFNGSGGSFSLSDNGSQTFNFTYSPTAHSAASDPIAINTTDGSTDNTNHSQQLTATLSATGVGPTLSTSVAAGSTINFGKVVSSQAALQTLTVSNSTSDSASAALTNLDILSANITGANAQLFSVLGFKPGTVLSKSQVDNLQINFTPSPGLSGTETATLTLVTDEGAANGANGKSVSFTLTGQASATSEAYWKGAHSGAWNSTSSGSNWTVAAGSSTEATSLPTANTNVFFGANNQATSNTTLGQDFSIKSLNFTAGATPTTIGGTNTLTIGSGVTVASGTGNQNINANVQLGATQTWTVNSGSTLSVGGQISGAGSAALVKDGAGGLVLSGSNTYSGGTTVTAGTMLVANALALPIGQDLSITGSGSLVSLGSGLTSAVKVGTLSIDGGIATPLATLDVGNNELIANTILTSLDTIRSQVHAGSNGGAWTGAGITSSVAAADAIAAIGKGNTAVGFAGNADFGMGLTSFGGVAVNPSSILLRYTLLGDANLDGKVDISDFTLLRHSFGMTSHATWDEGDFDYDGKVDINDFLILRAHFGKSLTAGNLGVPLTAALAATMDFQIVPEPASVDLLIAGGLVLVGGAVVRAYLRRKLLTKSWA